MDESADELLAAGYRTSLCSVSKTKKVLSAISKLPWTPTEHRFLHTYARIPTLGRVQDEISFWKNLAAYRTIPFETLLTLLRNLSSTDELALTLLYVLAYKEEELGEDWPENGVGKLLHNLACKFYETSNREQHLDQKIMQYLEQAAGKAGAESRGAGGPDAAEGPRHAATGGVARLHHGGAVAPGLRQHHAAGQQHGAREPVQPPPKADRVDDNSIQIDEELPPAATGHRQHRDVPPQSVHVAGDAAVRGPPPPYRMAVQRNQGTKENVKPGGGTVGRKEKNQPLSDLNGRVRKNASKKVTPKKDTTNKVHYKDLLPKNSTIMMDVTRIRKKKSAAQDVDLDVELIPNSQEPQPQQQQFDTAQIFDEALDMEEEDNAQGVDLDGALAAMSKDAEPLPPTSPDVVAEPPTFFSQPIIRSNRLSLKRYRESKQVGGKQPRLDAPPHSKGPSPGRPEQQVGSATPLLRDQPGPSAAPPGQHAAAQQEEQAARADLPVQQHAVATTLQEPRPGPSTAPNYPPVRIAPPPNLGSPDSQLFFVPETQEEPNQVGGGRRYRTVEELLNENPNCRGEEIVRRIVLREPGPDENPFLHAVLALQEIFDDMKALCGPRDVMSFSVYNVNDPGFIVSLRVDMAENLRAEQILDHINAVAQSNRNFCGTGVLVVTCLRLINPEGRGRLQREVEKPLSKIKRGVIHIRNVNPFHRGQENFPKVMTTRTTYELAEPNNFCGVYSIFIGMKHRIWVTTRDPADRRAYERAREQRGAPFARAIDNFIDIVGLDLTNRGLDRADLTLVQEKYRDFRIVAYESGSMDSLIFQGNVQNAKYGDLILCLENGHFMYVTSKPSFFDYIYHCGDCNVFYRNKGQHRCGRHCYLCGFPDCAGARVSIVCDTCGATFKSASCYDKHKTVPPHGSIPKCETYKKCDACGVMVTIAKQPKKKGDKQEERPPHSCGEYYCHSCKSIVPRGHNCFMVPKQKLNDSQIASMRKKSLVTVFDIETAQNVRMENGNYRHVPNVICALTSCPQCWEKKDFEKKCKSCGERRLVLKNLTPEPVDLAARFLEWAWRKARGGFEGVRNMKNCKHYILGHYAGAFDHQFLMAAALSSPEWSVGPPLMRGTKIIQAELIHKEATLILLDFYAYVPRGLADMCKAFGLDPKLAKGSFPHLMNRPEYYNYCENAMPDMKFWAPEAMSVTKKLKFELWWAEEEEELRRSGTLWDFKDRIISYCMQDVYILEGAMKAFYSGVSQLGVFPMYDGPTIASLAMTIFERVFMEPLTIGILPRGGYRLKDNYSQVALEWLVGLELENDIIIQHAARGPEAVVANTPVDGFHAPTNTVYQFWGCFWHGHPGCANIRWNSLKPDLAQFLAERAASTEVRSEYIRRNNYKLVGIWECQYQQQMKTKQQLRLRVHRSIVFASAPIMPRDAIKGGRTETFRLLSVGPIFYYDYTSLYPSIQKYTRFPIGHPKVYLAGDPEMPPIAEIFGLVKCRVLAPPWLPIPVLPLTVDGKNMFVLCLRCAMEQNQHSCEHSEADRAFTGTWCSTELHLAMEQNYTILAIYEVWHFEETAIYDPVTKLGGLWTGFINHFLKQKQESSGYPEDCDTPEKKAAYIEWYYQEEGIRLDPAKIEKNETLRTCSKLFLNSLWGKFCQNCDQPSTEFFKDFEPMWNLLDRDDIEVSAAKNIDGKAIAITYKNRVESPCGGARTNYILAAFVTAHARIVLYKAAHRVGYEDLNYMDTDSLMANYRGGQRKLKTDPRLGGFTDELLEFRAPGEPSTAPEPFISLFASSGPKSYCLRVENPNTGTTKEVRKLKGFSIAANNQEQLGMDSLVQIINGDLDSLDVHQLNQISRTNMFEVYTTPDKVKKFRLVFNKRRRVGEYDTLPFGTVDTAPRVTYPIAKSEFDFRDWWDE